MVVEAQHDPGDTDDGPKAARSAAPHEGVERTCVVTRQTRHPDDLIRFVQGPENAVVADLKRKLPGRGVWVGLSKVLVAQAIKKQAFSRALKEKVVASPDMPDLIEKLLRRDALQALSMANKVGLVTTGYSKVESAINSGGLCALIHASDGAPDGKRKLGQVLRRKFGEDSRPEIGVFTVDELDSALGRGNVVHAALVPGSAAKVFLASARRLAVYRGDEEAKAPSGEAVLTKNLTTNLALEQDFNADSTNGQGPGTQDRYE